MKRYYKSKNIPNPFELPEEQEEDFEGETPKEPLEVKDGKTTAKGAPKAAPVVKAEKLTDAQKEKIAGLENEMAEVFGVFDLLGDEERSSIIASITDRMQGEQDLAEDEDKEYYDERVKIYSKYLNTNQ
jgi:hypothetical protein